MADATPTEATSTEGTPTSRGERRWLPKFSLRALLLLLVVIAIGSAKLGSWIQAKRREETARLALFKHNNSFRENFVIQFDSREVEQRGVVVRGLSLILPRECLYTVRAVHINDAYISPPLDQLVNFPHLRELFLQNYGPLPDQPLEYIAGHRELEVLVFQRSGIQDEDWGPLRHHRQFKKLWLGRSRLTDKGVALIVQNKGLTHLELDCSNISDQSLPLIAELTELECLALRETQVTSSGLNSLLKLPKLKELYLYGTAIDDSAVPVLSKMTQMFRLDIRETKLTDEGKRQLRLALPKCTYE